MALHYLNYKEHDLRANGGSFTAKEIAGQPELWINTFDKLSREVELLKAFLTAFLKEKESQIILTGAGTSAFIGEVLEGPLQKKLHRNVRAVATTDLVTHPELFFRKTQPTLLISFARSGNSPESLKAVELADMVCEHMYHLVITCNPDGALVKSIGKDNSFVFMLPPEADDQSLAMTGSFTSMLLTGLLLGDLDHIKMLKGPVAQISRYGKRVFDSYLQPLFDISNLPFERAVFLGSGPFRGIAREAHLKLQELTDGKVICKHDSFLGFRHGPKAVINDKTIVFFFVSNHPYAQRYEVDLINSINSGVRGLYRIAVLENDHTKIHVDLKIVLGNKSDRVEEEFLTLPYVLPAQVLGFYKSLHFKLKPDAPSVSGTITRVVQGVHVYPYKMSIQK